jgi:hypothetical protein
MRVFDSPTKSVILAGEVGAVVGATGVGKSALFVHVALDAIVRDEQVLHISLQDGADHVRASYDEVFQGIASLSRFKSDDKLAVLVERHRVIHSYLNRSFSVDDLSRTIQMLSDVMHINPTCVLIDGFDKLDLAPFRALAESTGFGLWVTVSKEESLDLEPFFTVVELGAERGDIALKLLKQAGTLLENSESLLLESSTLLSRDEDSWDPVSSPGPQDPSECTLYSGGAEGTEAYFGDLSEVYGLDEVNFTFEGHKQTRVRGSYVLAERELAVGDVSLLYVSRRLNRTYSREGHIRKVLQTIWHQASWADQVFVVGDIQEDGTVVGGTGWAVELARMWRKNLWVFDQSQGDWFRWINDEWTRGIPVVEASRFCGTGTRQLSSEGREAIKELFERSFGAM